MWQGYQISEKYNREFKESVILNPNVIDSNKNYTIMMIYGKSGSSKSTCINLYMRNDILQTGMNDDGITKGIYLCKKNDLIILDTEGVGTDNRGCDRTDIVSIFCISSCFVIVQPILNSFPKSDIVQIIEEILIVFERIVRINPNYQNKPSFLILLPIFKPVSQSRLKQYKTKAKEFINGSIFDRVRDYFSQVNAKILSPLDQKTSQILIDNEKISYNDVSSEYLKKVDNAFKLAIQSSSKKKGSIFKSLNIILSLARENKTFDPLIIEKANNTLFPLIKQEFSNAKSYYSSINSFQSFVLKCKENLINEINNIDIGIYDKIHIMRILLKEFESQKEIEITNFNNYISDNLPRVADIKCEEISTSITGTKKYDYSDLIASIISSIIAIQECEILPTSNIQFLNSFRNKKNQQLLKLNINNFDEKFIEFRIIKPSCSNFFNSYKNLVSKIKPMNACDEIKTLQKKCKIELKKKIKDYQRNCNKKI